MNHNLTEIVFIIDRSGSMYTTRHDTIGGFNSFIENQRKQPGEAKVTIAQFSHIYDITHNGVDIHAVPLLNEKTYIPCGSTALYDAVCRTIDDVGRRLANTPEHDRPGLVHVVILTDGEENCSEEFKNPDEVKRRINHQRDVYSWKFDFIGANQDAIQAARTIGIGAGQALTYTQNAVGTRSTFNSISDKFTSYRMANSTGASVDVTMDFSEKDRKAQEDAKNA
jgi:hypothetical protein